MFQLDHVAIPTDDVPGSAQHECAPDNHYRTYGNEPPAEPFTRAVGRRQHVADEAGEKRTQPETDEIGE